MACGMQPVHCLLEQCRVVVCEDDRSTCFGKSPRRRETDAPTSARNKCNFSIKQQSYAEKSVTV
jgi:hypothetical protein